MSKVYRVGATCPDKGRVEWLFINEEWPMGRYTTDEQQAMVWANECASMFNTDPNSGSTEWTGTVWLDDLPDWSASVKED